MLTNRQLFFQYLAQTSDFPLALEIERAEGVYLFGPSGKYIDLISGIGVSIVGHRHPKVIEALENQLQKYLHLMVYGEFVQGPQVNLAQRLVQTLGVENGQVYLVNSGSEAVEGALKLAKRYTGRPGLITFKNAYHGSTQGALSVSGNEKFKQAYRPLVPSVRVLDFNRIDTLNVIGKNTAAVIIEPVQGEAGINVADPEFMQLLRNKCTETGAMLIFDEIQCGYGRTGKFWAHQYYGIQPDILVTAKGIGGGMPIGAFIASGEIMKVIKNDPLLGHITTFGGHPLSAVAASATIDVLIQEDLINQVEEKANRFRNNLNHPLILDIRNKGLLMAVEFESFEILKPVIDQAIQQGVLTDWFLYCDNSMRIAPPLTINHDEIDEASEKILKAVKLVS
jgi:acetylornithine/succinyldiaminopimelate/putrescine aminotransferase